MRILFIDFTLPYLLRDSEYPVGGWAVELNTWLKGIIATGHSAGVLTWKGAADYVGTKPGFDLLETYDPDKGVKILKYFYAYIPALLLAAREYDPDILIQACSGLNTGIMAFVARRLGVPFVYRVANDMDVDDRCKTRLRGYEQLAYRYGLRKARAVLCQNQYQYTRLHEWFPDKPLHILHNPFDTGRDLPRVNARGIKEYIAWLGVFSQQKNMPLLYRLARSLPDIPFRIAGMPASKQMDAETGKAVEELRKLPNVEFTGYVQRKDVLGFLAGAVALLSTSHYEGFSNTFLESLAAGTPVVAPRRVDPAQIITKNAMGLTAENDAELPDLIRRIWDMADAEYGGLAEKCRAYVLEQHAPEAKAKELITFLQQLIDQS